MSSFLSRITLCLLLFFPTSIFSQTIEDSSPLLMVGASYFKGSTRIDDRGASALGGISVGLGSYFDLGSALIQNPKLNGLIVNEAHVGATTFDRYSCEQLECSDKGKMLGYKQQFERAIKRVSIAGQEIFNAHYILIGLPNDCIHSDAFGIPQSATKKCMSEDVVNTTNNILEVIHDATKIGLTPIVIIPPNSKSLNLKTTQEILNLEWVLSESEYHNYSNDYLKRLKESTDKAVFLDIWSDFEHRGDGIHPNRSTVIGAAKKIADFIARDRH